MRKLLFFSLIILLSDNIMAQSSFHTDPGCWKEPRIFHESVKLYNVKDRVTIENIKTGEPLPEITETSPNKAYYFYVQQPDTLKNPPWKAVILIYTERDYLIKFTVRKIRGVKTVRWINEKLLFMRIWLGRIVALDMIFDVEREQIIYQEAAVWGGLAFQQFQQQRNENKKHDGK